MTLAGTVDIEEVYYLKLEALWILTNLSYCEEEGVMRMLTSSFDQHVVNADYRDVANDVQYRQSLIL